MFAASRRIFCCILTNESCQKQFARFAVKFNMYIYPSQGLSLSFLVKRVIKSAFYFVGYAS